MPDQQKSPDQPHGFLFRMTEFGLGVASAASLVMSFIPGVNFIGAAVQGGVTLVQTGMDLVTKGVKKAAFTFLSGAVLTAANLIPFLGAEARGVEAAGEAAVKGTGFFARVGEFFKPVTEFFGRVKKAIGGGITWLWENTLGRIPGVNSVLNSGFGKLKEVDKKWAGAFSDHKWVQPVTKPIAGFHKAHPFLSTAGQIGATAVGAKLADIGNTPPMNLFDKDLYRGPDSKEGKGEWVRREDVRRAAAAAEQGAGVPQP